MTAPARRGWRPDIQALRALAVLAVVLFHLDLLPRGLGYLGVDVFFVISGYLIGGKLEDAAEGGHLRLGAFWARRVVRLWPAASVTLLVSWVAGAVLLDPYEMRLFLGQLAGAATLTANVVLWRQVDYFGSGAAIKPLLHVWSLAVEEQFYLLLPFLFLSKPARCRGGLLVLAMAVSLGLWLYALQHAPSAGFYGLPTRVWELGVGVLAALGQRRLPDVAQTMERAGPWIGPAAGLGVVLLLVAGHALIGEAAAMAMIVVATVCLLLAQGNVGVRFPVWLMGIGDRSYALYLSHWPIIALVHNMALHDLPGRVILALAGVIALATELLYRGVDRRVRPVGHWLRWLAVHGLIALAAGGMLWWGVGVAVDGGFRQASEGLSLACNRAARFDPAQACRSAPQADVLVWGDSFAMQLVPGLIVPGAGGSGIVQATHVTCGPLLGLAPTNDSNPPGWARDCIGWNDSVLAGLRHMPQVRTVVLASIFSQYVAGVEPGWRLYRREGGATVPQDDRLVAAALLRTVAAIRATGRRVILYRPQPYGDFDIGRCLARRQAHVPVFGAAQDCSFPRDGAASARVGGFLTAALAGGGIATIDPEPVLCQQDLCRPTRDGVPLYADRVHLSPEGSIWLARRLGLAARINHDAR